MFDFTPTFILEPDPEDTTPLRDAFAPVADSEVLDAYSDAQPRGVDEGGAAVVRVEPHEQRGRGGVGSGVIISPDGLVLPTSHVVNGARDIQLLLPDGRTTKA